MKPTEKQIWFVEKISAQLKLSPPNEYTKDAYSNFINKNIHKYNISKKIEHLDTWAVINGYD